MVSPVVSQGLSTPPTNPPTAGHDLLKTFPNPLFNPNRTKSVAHLKKTGKPLTVQRQDPELGRAKSDTHLSKIWQRHFKKEIGPSADEDDSVELFLSQLSLKSSKDIPAIAKKLVSYLANDVSKDLNILTTHWKAFLKAKREKSANFYQLLSQVSMDDKGIPLVCAYVKHFPLEEKEYVSQIAEHIYQHLSKQEMFFEKLSVFTQTDLKNERIDTLFRNRTLVSKLCQACLTSLLGPTLEHLLNEIVNSADTSAFVSFLHKLYDLKPPEEVKKLVKIRRDGIGTHFSIAQGPEEVKRAISAGVNELLFLAFISPFLVDLSQKKSEHTPKIRTLAKIIQKLANQQRFEEQSADSQYNAIYEQFAPVHQTFIDELLKD